MRFIILFALFVMMLIPMISSDVYAHSVHGGIFGCPVGACGITDWHILKTASNTMFNVSLVVYVTILILFSYFLHRRRIILR